MTAQDPAVSPGRPWPIGVTPEEHGVNVAVWAPSATGVQLCVFDDDGHEERIDLPYRDGGIWHAHVAGIAVGTRYGLRAHGEFDPARGTRFNPDKLLIDPYARMLDGPVRWHPLMSDAGDSAAVVPKGIVTGAPAGPEPAENRPQYDMAELMIYEAHVKGLTAAHPEVPPALRGTYAGMAHPAIIGHLTELGVNAVELLPVQAFVDDEHLVRRGAVNYWGYQPIAWFAPEPRYATENADAELRHLVHTLHAAGIEVILDVVYNHSGEGDAQGPTLNLRGLHNTGYYRLAEDAGEYIDDSGTGNTLALDQPMVTRLVLDSMRHWVTRYGVDGFRFDLAATLGRTAHGFDPAAAFFSAVGQDPVLAGVKLIAEPWDLGPGGYRLGAFPPPWSEWNDRYRDGVRRLWRGDPVPEVDIGSKLLGSAKHFDHAGRSAAASVNFLTAHDGFTLADVVSYSRKHNEGNGEGGADGHEENFSDNLGVEGASDDPAIIAARSLRVRAMIATLLASQGVPMLTAGDELGNSQGGNNNAYAQDNEIGWVDWSAPDSELLAFVRRAIRVRHELPVLRQPRFLHGGVRGAGDHDIVWLRADGSPVESEDWSDLERKLVIAQIRGAAGDPRTEALGDVVMLILNLWEDVRVQLPGGDWRIRIDSARPQAQGVVQESYPALRASVIVLAQTDEA